jgi:hypothetical protein
MTGRLIARFLLNETPATWSWPGAWKGPAIRRRFERMAAARFSAPAGAVEPSSLSQAFQGMIDHCCFSTAQYAHNVAEQPHSALIT